VALVQLDAVDNSTATANATATDGAKHENYVVGITAVLATCLTAGFAGVYFEMMLKDPSSTTPFWIRNLQLYTSGVCMAAMTCLTMESTSIMERGFFAGYDTRVICIVGVCVRARAAAPHRPARRRWHIHIASDETS